MSSLTDRKSTRVSVRIPNELARRLALAAAVSGTTPAGATREAIGAWVAQVAETTAAPEQDTEAAEQEHPVGRQGTHGGT